jgi:hypothetical protein
MGFAGYRALTLGFLPAPDRKLRASRASQAEPVARYVIDSPTVLHLAADPPQPTGRLMVTLSVVCTSMVAMMMSPSVKSWTASWHGASEPDASGTPKINGALR